jgi:hypothetical protein
MKKYLYLISIIILFLTACATNSQYIGKVNNNWIQKDEYMIQVHKLYESFMIEHNYSPDTQTRKLLAEQAWNNIVNAYKLRDIFIEYSVSASIKETVDTLKSNIPELMLNSPRFKNKNNEFDYESYYSSLISDKPENLSWLRNHYQTTYIPLKKLQAIILSERKINQNELKQLYDLKNTSVNIEKYTFDLNFIHTTQNKDNNPTAFFLKDYLENNKIAVTEQEIQEYYNNNKKLYFVEPQTDLNWVLFDNIPSKADSLKTKALADSLYNLLIKGKDFSKLANDFSSAPYNRLKGYAGFIEIDEFEKDISEKIKASTSNEVIKPFYYNNSWWIIRVNEKTLTMAKLHIIKLDIITSKETMALTKKKLERFSELSYQIGFTKTAQELSLSINQSDNLSLKNSKIEGLGDAENIIRRAMLLPNKTILEPILINDNQTYIIFQVEKNHPGYFKNLIEVYEDIEKILISKKSKDLLISTVHNFKEDFNKNILPTGIITQKNIQYNESIKWLPYEFIKECVTQQDNSMTNIYQNEDEIYFAKIISKNSNSNSQSFSTQIPELTKELQNINSSKYFENWLQKQMSKGKVKDLRPNDLL